MNMRTPPALIPEEEDNEAPNTVITNGAVEDDFSEYLWMADVELEDFDRQVEEELLEEAFIEACFEEMMAEEEAVQWYTQNGPDAPPPGVDLVSMEDALKGLNIMDSSKPKEEVVLNSKLNPEAPEFVPRYLKT